MTSNYKAISKYYDRLMSDYPYESVLQFIKKHAHGRGVELGSGTGKLTIALNAAGLKTIGVDVSEEMLSEAMANARKACVSAVFVHSDVREYEFFPCDFVLAPCDVFNYVTDAEDVEDILGRAYEALSDGGIMLFDLSTAAKLQGEAGTFVEDYEDVTLVWDNSFDGTFAELGLTVFEMDGDGKYIRNDECHVQRAYSVREMMQIVRSVGFSVELMNEELSPIGANEADCCSRLFFLLRK